MTIDPAHRTWPTGIWAAVGSEAGASLGILVCDQGNELERFSASPSELSTSLAKLKNYGAEFVAVQSLAVVARTVSAESTFDLASFVALDDWSSLVGIRPRSCGSTLDAAVERLAEVLDRLAALDPSVLNRSDQYLGWRRSGDQLLIRAATAHSRARHGEGSNLPAELAFLQPRDRPERLRKIKDANGVDPETIADAFDPSGAIAARYAAWEPRPQQREMATEVARRLRDGGELIAEAGTGTGKSLAYLVPALAHAMQTGEQVIIATNTRVLQDQLAQKDAPVAVAAANANQPDQLPIVQVLKGRSNYLCLRRWFADIQQQPLATIDEEAEFRSRTNIWLTLTETGEQSELPLDRSGAQLFNKVSADGEACDASRCQFQQRNQCFLYRARRSAESAHVVITNHALLMTDVVKEGEALPDARHVIIDEAHHLEDQATNSFQVANSSRLLTAALTLLTGESRRNQVGLLAELDSVLNNRKSLKPDPDALGNMRIAIQEVGANLESVRATATLLFGELADVVDQSGERSRDYSARVRVTTAIRHSGSWQSVERRWDTLNLAFANLISRLASLQADFPEFVAISATSDLPDDDLIVRTEDLTNRLGVVRYELTRMSLEMNDAIHNPKTDQVYWLECRPGDRRDAVLYSAPLELGEYLKRHLYSRLDSLVLTSATMTTGGNARYIRRRLGLDDADELRVTSPFDYETNAMIVVPNDLPEPNQPGFDIATHNAILATAAAAHGRTLVLFTSIYAMNQARLALSDRFAAEGLQLVTQHEDGSAEQLAERLRTFDRTVVFGAGAFWEGVDVPGPALSALIIAKLPFPVPTDPVYAARSETFENGWSEYTMPQTILKVRQGFGRLIRTQSDRGVCVILDRRLVSKRYGAQILESLPPARREYCTISQIGPTVDHFLYQQG